jgi:hypothetical protein
LKADIRVVQERAALADVETQVKLAGLDVKLVRLERNLIGSGIAALIAAGGILFAALHLWPPHP